MPETTDAQTGVAATLPPGELPLDPDASSVLRRFPGASRLYVQPEERAALEEPFLDDEIEILPTGEPYAPHGRYRTRLNHVFGPGQWALLPLTDHLLDGKTVVQPWVLTVRGCVAAVASGAGSSGFDSDIAQQTEAAKSQALTRACKDLGIGLFLAQKRWAESFRERLCLLVEAKDRKDKDWRRCWRRADGVPFPYEGQIHRQPKGASPASPAPADPAPASSAPDAPPAAPAERPAKAKTAKEREEEFFAEMANERKRVGNAVYLKVLEKFGHTAMGAIPPAKRAAVLAELQGLPGGKS